MEVKGCYLFNGGKRTIEGRKKLEIEDLMVHRLREAGAIIFGTTVMVEYGVSHLGWNVHWQGPWNPYKSDRYSGGSSSGSAVSVALGLVPLSIGFDGGGSIRIPSSMSGIHGLATTYGRLPLANNATIRSSVVKGGPMTQSAEDAAILYAAISPTDKNHFYSKYYGESSLPEPNLVAFNQIKDLKGIRLGIFKEWYNDAQSDIVASCDKAVMNLVARGAEVVSIEIPHLHWFGLSHAIRISHETSAGADREYFQKEVLLVLYSVYFYTIIYLELCN